MFTYYHNKFLSQNNVGKYHPDDMKRFKKTFLLVKNSLIWKSWNYLLSQSLTFDNTFESQCKSNQFPDNSWPLSSKLHHCTEMRFASFLSGEIYYCHNSKSIGKLIGKMHFCALVWADFKMDAPKSWTNPILYSK